MYKCTQTWDLGKEARVGEHGEEKFLIQNSKELERRWLLSFPWKRCYRGEMLFSLDSERALFLLEMQKRWTDGSLNNLIRQRLPGVSQTTIIRCLIARGASLGTAIQTGRRQVWRRQKTFGIFFFWLRNTFWRLSNIQKIQSTSIVPKDRFVFLVSAQLLWTSSKVASA